MEHKRHLTFVLIVRFVRFFAPNGVYIRVGFL